MSLTLGAQGTTDDPEGLPYYMQAMESAYAGISQSMAWPATEDENTPEQAASGQSDTT